MISLRKLSRIVSNRTGLENAFRIQIILAEGVVLRNLGYAGNNAIGAEKETIGANYIICYPIRTVF